MPLLAHYEAKKEHLTVSHHNPTYKYRKKRSNKGLNEIKREAYQISSHVGFLFVPEKNKIKTNVQT